MVLGDIPPVVDKSEKQLPRPTRCTLAQLRSGISVYPKSYLSILNPEVIDACPHCGASPHITRLRLRFQTDRSNATLTVDRPSESCHFPGIGNINISLLINVSLLLCFFFSLFICFFVSLSLCFFVSLFFYHFPLSLSVFLLLPYHTCTCYSGYNNKTTTLYRTLDWASCFKSAHVLLRFLHWVSTVRLHVS